MSALRRRAGSILAKAKTKWQNSGLYKRINQRISKRFQKRLTNRDFTILCSNCIGGVIYNRLGLRFLSPTINLFLPQRDFVQFCLNQELVFVSSEFPYPVAELRGSADGSVPTIRIFFNHYHSDEEAAEKWNDRKQRIRRDNLYLILYKLDGITVEELKKLEQMPCQNKVVLTSAPIPEIPWSFYIKPSKHRQYASSYLDRNIIGMRRFERKFDFIDFLNYKAHE